MLLSNVIPLAASVIILPILISSYGVKDVGMIVLCWSIVGYLTLFDLGIGRSLTQYISRYSENSKELNISQLASTAIALSTLIGSMGGLSFWIATHYFAKIIGDEKNAIDTEQIFLYISIMVPITIATNVIRGIFEALQKFILVSVLRTIHGLSLFIAPYAATYTNHSIDRAILFILLSRVLLVIISFIYLKYYKIIKERKIIFDYISIKNILKQSKWMLVTSIVGPFLDYLDRFFILYIIGSGAVAYYAIPFDILTKFTLITMAVSTVLFPIFSTKESKCKGKELYEKSILITPMIIFTISLTLGTFASEILKIWLGKLFVLNSYWVIIYLSVGIIINSYAQLVFGYLQGQGHSIFTAKLHLVEVVPHLAVLITLIHTFGITGAAFAWLLRSFVDLMLMVVYLKKINFQMYQITIKKIRFLILYVLIIGISLLLNSIESKISIILISLMIVFSIIYKNYIINNYNA